MSRKVYPRACGGTLKKLSMDHLLQGLSPRLRGNVGRRLTGWHVGGSIPALAGERVRDEARNGACRVYPRACGGTLQTSRRFRYA